ncbi:MAG: NUDIX hydrolase [Planctomycetes bacterium]|nr:NUDIX hydrolase [Planctomycetota bacterium]
MSYTYPFARPALTADCAVFRRRKGKPELLLIERARDPHRGCWAFPGGFVDQDEDLEDAARRELKEETGLVAGELLQAGAFGRPGRDPRGHTVTVVYTGELTGACEPAAGDDAAKARWFPLDALPSLAFDHREILEFIIERGRAGG